MAESLEEIAQLDGAATTVETLYTVPASTMIMARLCAVNRTAADITVRVAVRIAGEALANKQYKAYDQILMANNRLVFEAWGLKATDVLSVYASATGVSWTLNGSRLT